MWLTPWPAPAPRSQKLQGLIRWQTGCSCSCCCCFWCCPRWLQMPFALYAQLLIRWNFRHAKLAHRLTLDTVCRHRDRFSCCSGCCNRVEWHGSWVALAAAKMSRVCLSQLVNMHEKRPGQEDDNLLRNLVKLPLKSAQINGLVQTVDQHC